MIWLSRPTSLGALRNIRKPFLSCRRTAIIPPRNTVKKRRRRIKDVSFEDLSLRSLDGSNSKALEFKLKQLQEFTRNLREQIKVADSNHKKNAHSHDDSNEKTSKSSVDLIFNNLMPSSSTNGGSLVPPRRSDNLSSIIMATDSMEASKLLPEAIRERINDDAFVLASLTDRSHQNWNGIVSRLHSSQLRLQGISTTTLKNWLLPRAKWLSYENIEKLDQMLLERVEGDITKFSNVMYESLFYNLANLHPAQGNDLVFNKMKELLGRYDESRGMDKNAVGSFEMNQFILNSCIKYSCKAMSFEMMDFFLSKFKNDYGLAPNRENYTTIIQFYTKLGATKQAWDIFDTMKFLSKSHEPDVIAYNSVLHLCSKDRDFARAIDLYQEMIDKNLEPTVQTLAIMAKTLARASADPVTSENKAESLRLLGWKYIHDIQNKSHNMQSESPLYHTLEAMMALAAYDGDVGLSRALYFKYTTQRYEKLIAKSYGQPDFKKVWQQALDPRLFNYLLMAYSKYKTNHLPILLGYEEGMKLRRNIMNSVDYTGKQGKDSGVNCNLPLLPFIDLTEAWQILSESRALWQFNLEFGGLYDLKQNPYDCTMKDLRQMVLESQSLDEFKLKTLHKIAKWKSDMVNHSILNTVSLTSFLTIPISMGDEKEFLLRFGTFCFQPHEFDSMLRQIYDSCHQLEGESQKEDHETSSVPLLNEDELADKLTYILSMKHKIAANCAIYELMMKAAAAFKDNSLSTKAWKDRGEFRKTLAFKKLNEPERVRRDKQFAALMVQFFADQKMFTDALGIIMTSQRYIDWTYSMVKTLHRGLVEIEDEKSAKILLEIVNKKSPVANLEDRIRELKF